MAEERTTGESSMQASLRRRYDAIRKEATSLAGTAAKLAQAMDQVLDNGGSVSIQSQMSFITGAHARMMKDVGVIEYLLAQGVVVKRPAQTK